MNKTSTYVHHTGITVSDLNRSIPFYRDVLGFAIQEPFAFGGEIIGRVNGVAGGSGTIAFAVTPTGHKIELIQFETADRKSETTWPPNNPGAMHLGIVVQDIDKIFAAARACGFTAPSDIQTFTEGSWAGLRVIYVRDPDGAYLELIQLPDGMVI